MRILVAAAALTFLVPAVKAETLFSETSEQAAFEVAVAVSGLRNPSSFAFVTNGDAFLSGWYGDLWRVPAGQGRAVLLSLDLDLAEGRGLRTVSPHPQFADNGTLYFCYANGTGDRNQTHIARGRLQGGAVTEVEVVFEAENFSEGRLHQSCTIVWDTNETFLLALGDRFHELEQAQQPGNYYGVIVHLNDDGSPTATELNRRIPDSNPGVWSYGHRNVQGFTIDPASGELWAHEHGPQGGDEVNQLRAGLNYGWPAATYGIDYDDTIISETPLLEGTEPPIYYWYPSIAPSGLAIYSGDEFPKWRGDLFVGGLASQRLHRLERHAGRVISEEELLSELDVRLRDVRMGPDGSLYVLTDEEEGRLLRIVGSGDQ